jgi:hypothetical protein
VLGWTWAASIALHVAGLGGFGWAAVRSWEPARAPAPPAVREAGAREIAIDLPVMTEGTLLADRPRDPTGDPPTYSGGAPVARLDQAVNGRGGDAHAEEPATNLSDRDDGISRTLDLLDRLDRDQQQRLATSRERQSWEDRRSSKQPMELTFLASGATGRAERRAPTEADPSRGGARPLAASAQGGVRGDRADEDALAEDEPRAGASREGSRESAAGLGVHDGREGRDHRAGARVMRARPDVVLAAVSVPAARRGRPRDDVDSDQEVANVVRSVVHASTAGGALGAGRGGAGGGGDPGAGGRAGAGSTGRPLGPGDAAWWDLNTNDPRLVPYFRRLHARLDPLWPKAFPEEEIYALHQGVAIFDVVIASDGRATVVWPPTRPSGIPAFDRNLYDVLRHAAPFDPLPASLGVSELRVRMPFDARNYVVK